MYSVSSKQYISPAKTGEKAGDGTVIERPALEQIINKVSEGIGSLEVQRNDQSSPLYSVRTFESLNLKPELLKGVYAMGFNKPSKIQEMALPILLGNPRKNLIAQSQSGTGKTAAFVLAMLSRVDATKEHPQVLCLAPTYELAIQIGEVVAKMAQFCPEIKIKYAVKGFDMPRGSKVTEHIVIGTPGKVLDWTWKFKFFDSKKIQVFVLDEADVMIGVNGQQDQCLRIYKNLPDTCQMLLFSATFGPEVKEFADSIVREPIKIGLQREQESLDNIRQYYIKCRDSNEKYEAITNIYSVISIGQAIIFCQTRNNAKWLSDKMTADGHAVAVLSGEQDVNLRLSTLDRFREGLDKVLITTNVLARGIDIEQVTLVVNFDLPTDKTGKPDFETYLHRIGRTGRFGKAGIAINLVDGSRSMDVCQEIELHFNRKIHLLNANDADEIEQLEA